jgi:CHAT domain-containing protein/Tfp pilus assembly protein PilF
MGKLRRGLLACGLLTLLLTAGVQAQADKPPEWTPEEKELADKATKLNEAGEQLYGMGKLKEAAEKFAEALALRRKLYPAGRFPDGHPDLAESLNNMGAVLLLQGESAKALTYHEQALALRRKLYPAGRFPDGHPDLAESLDNMGAVLLLQGESAKALTYHEQALAMRRQLYPQARFPDGHLYVATSLNNMGHVLRGLREPAKALPYQEQALAMFQKLYPAARFPDGHPYVATSLNNMGGVLRELGEPAKALPYHQQALAMFQKLYPARRFPDGHPDVAICLSNMGAVLEVLGQPAKALTYYEQALAMFQKLYPAARFPDGHRYVAISLNNMGHVLWVLGELVRALPYHEEALAVQQKLYPAARFPDGHPDLAASLNNLGFVLQALGKPAKGLGYYEQALAMYGQLSRRETGRASEATALAYRRTQLITANGYLSVAARLPPSAALYGPLWPARGGLLPLLQARHRAVLAQLAASLDARKDYADLVAVRQQISRLQVEAPKDEVRRKARDQELADLNDRQDRLERRLAERLPAFQRLEKMSAKGPADLARALARDAAFVDLLRYTHWEKGKSTGQRYGAFVMVPGRDAAFLQLGDAQPIDDAVAAWRKHIDSGQDSLAPAKLRELVWDEVARELPAQTRVVYLCPDGDLARLPFAALPGAKPGTVLLDDYAVAVVPSGPWLLEQLLYPPKPGTSPGRMLAVGDVAYGKSAAAKVMYPALAGTGREIERVLEAFGPDHGDRLAGAVATAAAVRDRLPKARYAHLATHGYFDQAALAAERKRLKEYLEKWEFQAEGHSVGVAAPNPAGYVGLALAGANDPTTAGPDGGILTGLAVVDLPLENLRLCVLSACETGLGELTEGEGVLGLQRAFHAAGCPNVVGSLWQVDDAATAALMAQFYHELRANRRPPLEALRQAQLTLYRHPERIADLAGERGRPALEAAARLGPAATPAKAGEAAKTTPTKLWAAFVLSGVGTAE